MSDFLGLFDSLPGVSCDRFDGANLQSDQFFLSHCHADHMKGLEELVPLLRRKNSVRVNNRIYCSIVSKAFLVRRHPNLDERFVRDLFPNEAVVVDVFDKRKAVMYKLRITGIPANHCPGSIMFLFEKLEDNSVSRRILYTGDFRLEGVPLPSLSALHEGREEAASPLQIDEMYLDTTFCSDEYPTFPARQEAINRIWDLVQDWIRKNGLYKKKKEKGKHVVLFHLPAQYGSESILKDIYEKSGLKWRIHTSDSRFNDYLCTDELGDCTDSDPRVAQWIHACSWKDVRSKKFCQKADSNFKTIPCQTGVFEVCHIRPSAMYFSRSRNLEDKVVKLSSPQYYRVCYSCHSSLQELLAFVRHFRPKRLIPCVKPPNSSISEVLEYFKDILPSESLNVDDIMSSLGSLSPEKTRGSSEVGSPGLKNFWSSPDEVSRKRKVSPVSMDVQSLQNKRGLFDHNDDLERSAPSAILSGSSDEDDILSGLKVARSRRKQFHRSKSAYAHASMPSAATPASPGGGETSKSRRASLPYNLKIPAITITPSSPSPDPNHPDYPEFYEDKLYLESKNMSSSTEESNNSTEGRSSGGRKDHEGGDSKDIMETDQGDSRRRSQDPVSVEMEEKGSTIDLCGESSSPKIIPESPEILELSSEGAAEDEASEEMESTPDLEEVLRGAKSNAERKNCENFCRVQSSKSQF